MKLVVIGLLVSFASASVNPEILKNALQSLRPRSTPSYFKSSPPVPKSPIARESGQCNQIVVVGKPPAWLRDYLRGLQSPVVMAGNRDTVVNGQTQENGQFQQSVQQSGQQGLQQSGQPSVQQNGQPQQSAQQQIGQQPGGQQQSGQPSQISPSQIPAPPSTPPSNLNMNNRQSRIPKPPSTPPPNLRPKQNYNANRNSNTGRPSHVPPPPGPAPKFSRPQPSLAPKGIKPPVKIPGLF
ncbi:hypothetical protein PSACC_00616 [Paramicrosporidium saccamoebae]|uniref:Uncharacterized protein n=1 Tax=Paramicrosporidium saccamoebae TaxID=1246581 RepID=A0A2H9TPH0_9FUNG|nr:hypothetical protein PSACC_00616 [Paramicrosporidium saccamoebae]